MAASLVLRSLTHPPQQRWPTVRVTGPVAVMELAGKPHLFSASTRATTSALEPALLVTVTVVPSMATLSAQATLLRPALAALRHWPQHMWPTVALMVSACAIGASARASAPIQTAR